MGLPRVNLIDNGYPSISAVLEVPSPRRLTIPHHAIYVNRWEVPQSPPWKVSGREGSGQYSMSIRPQRER